MAGKPSQGKLLYHLTRIENIPSILQQGLRPRRALSSRDFTDIADPEIVRKRAQLAFDPASYVPFHFFAKNPFDGSVCLANGPSNMAIVTIRRPQPGQPGFWIVPEHPLTDPRILTYEEGFSQIKWALLDSPQGRDYHNPAIKSACLAECLVDFTVTPDQFAFIFVADGDARRRLAKVAREAGVSVQVNPNMFPQVR